VRQTERPAGRFFFARSPPSAGRLRYELLEQRKIDPKIGIITGENRDLSIIAVFSTM
jgi:hypothetical protein